MVDLFDLKLKMMNIFQRCVQVEKSYRYTWGISDALVIRFYVFYCDFHQQKIIYMYIIYIIMEICDQIILLNASYCTTLSNSTGPYYFSNLFPNPYGCHIRKTWKCFTCFCGLHDILKNIYLVENFATNYIFTIYQLCELGQDSYSESELL